MAEIPNVIPGEPIESNWGNDIRDRAVMRYADATDRDFQDPFPDAGQVCWLHNPGVLQRYDGVEWLVIPFIGEVVQRSGDTMTGPLSATLFTGALDGQFVSPPDETGIGTDQRQVFNSGTLPPTPGSWLVSFTVAQFTWTSSAAVGTPVSAILQLNGFNRVTATAIVQAAANASASLTAVGSFPGGGIVTAVVSSGDSSLKNARDMFVSVVEIGAPPAYPS